MERTLIKYPDELLLQASEDVTVFDDELKELVQDMVEFIRIKTRRGTGQGIGLAAVQFGVLKRVIVAQPARNKKMYRVVNPVVTSVSEVETKMSEGCLSEPGIRVEVERPYSITFSGYTLDGEFKPNLRAAGIAARIIQHEMDHLDGVLLHSLREGLEKVGSQVDSIKQEQLLDFKEGNS